ncbi:MAG TPA: glycoside hydrolase domain-containing protein [Streptosporangiaceae bacterium]
MNVSNLLGIGFYLGGITANQDANCYIASKTWLTNLNNGWEVAPIYDSLQAPCNGYKYPMDTNGDTAHQQGINVADNAIGNWVDLGQHAGNIIYLDIEAYNNNNCNAEDRVIRFVNGWVNELHSYAFKAGLYSSVCSQPLDDYYGIAYPPDDVWIAQWNGTWTGSTFNNAGAFDVNTSCISDNHWHDRRFHQYTHNSTVTRNGVTLDPVDHDCLRGQLDGLYDYNNTCGWPNG